MKEKLIVIFLKMALMFETIAEFIAFPEVDGKEYKVSWLGFEGEYNW